MLAERHDESFTKPEKSFQRLPIGVLVHTIADHSRAAWLEVLHGANTRWGSRELASWISGSYGRSTSPVSSSPNQTRPTFVHGARKSELACVERLLIGVREEILDRIPSYLRAEERANVAGEMIAAGLVCGVHDALGSIGYAAVDCAEMTLVDRITSLVVADYLTRPGDYQWLRICEGCGELSFAWSPVHLAGCEVEPAVSCESSVAPRPGCFPTTSTSRKSRSETHQRRDVFIR